MSDLDRIRDKLGRERAGAEASAKAAAERARKAGTRRRTKVEKLADESLVDYERRRQRLENDLTGELPDDSPEPR